MRIHKLNSSIVGIVIGFTLITFGFQNCTKARFTIDEEARQKALDDGSVFGHGDDGNIAGGKQPGDDGSIPGGGIPGDDGSMPRGNLPGDDGAMPRGPVTGNDPSIPGMPKPPVNGNDPSVPGTPKPPVNGNDPSMPKPPVTGNDPSVPGTPKPPVNGNDPSVPKPPVSGNDPSVPSTAGSISVMPEAVCGPKSKQATLKTTTKVVAVLYKSENFISETPKVMQVWDSDADSSAIRAQLMDRKLVPLKLSKALAKGTYGVVIYDASKVKSPYTWEWMDGNASTAIAPVIDSVAHTLDNYSTFKVDSSGKQTAVQKVSLLVAFDEDAECKDAGSIDPLMLQLKTSTPQPIVLTAPESGVMFDLFGKMLDNRKVQTSWFASAESENYFLALPNKDGQVLGIAELFGDVKRNGFAELRRHDENGDNVISKDDPVFSKLRLWKDKNLDGIAQSEELFSMDEKEVVAIDLRYDRKYKEVDKYGNMVKYKSVVIMKDNSYGLVYDLYLRYIMK